MTELFNDLPESKSPRMLWMERHGVTCERFKDVFSDKEEYEYSAWHGDFHEAKSAYWEEGPDCKLGQVGDTKHDALVNLAKVNGWLLWNEEGAE